MLPKKMKAAFLDAPGKISLREIEAPSPAQGEVLVRVKAVGVCGSDIKFFRHGHIGEYVAREPLILGHEATGEVVELGDGVNSPAVGTAVAIEPGWPCGRCAFCRSGKYNLCRELFFMATPPDHGAFCEYVCVPADFAHTMPESMDFAEGAMMEPLAVGVHACNQGELKAGMTVLISGGGTIGLCCMMAAKSMGAGKILLTEPDAFRRDKAEELGADGAFDPADNKQMDELKEALGDGAHVIMETSGVSRVIGDSVKMLHPGGCVVCVGFPLDETVPIDITGLINREGCIQTVWRYVNDYPYAIMIASKGEATVANLITHRYPLERLQEAMENAGADGTLKALIEI